eukprot:m.172210 g.172210  ORF g.172210 m.172210 type:complete len:476 (-) comp13487_c0_seq1:155-1582(-)
MGGTGVPGGGKRLISRWEAVITLIKCNWGIGMMAMPYMLYCSGPISGVFMFIASMLLSQFSIVNLCRVKALLEVDNDIGDREPLLNEYEDDEDLDPSSSAINNGKEKHRGEGLSKTDLDFTSIMKRSFGAAGEWAAIFSIFVSTYGSCVAYLLFIRDNMSKFFPGAFEEPDMWVWVSCVPLCGLAWPDSVGFLAPFSLVGLAAALAFAIVVVYNAADEMSPDQFMHNLHDSPAFKPATFPLALSIAAFCNEGIVVLTPSTQSAMRRPETYEWTAFWGIVYFIFCYMAVGIAGVMLYHGDVKGEMSLNFTTSQPIYAVAAVLYSIQLIPTYAVVYYVLYESLEGKWARWLGSTRQDKLKIFNIKLMYFANRCFWIVISGLLALEVPHFGDFLGLIGALGTSLAVYVLPQIAFLKVVPAKSGGTALMYRIGCYLLTLFGVALAVGGTYQSAAEMFSKSTASSTGNHTTTHSPTTLMG